jgi:hypothetical protein
MSGMTHVGLRTYRFRDNPEEKRIAELWRKWNLHGNLLAHALDERPVQGGRPLDPTKRDCVVAATVIQWLGSPVGQIFLEEFGYKRIAGEPGNDEEKGGGIMKAKKTVKKTPKTAKTAKAKKTAKTAKTAKTMGGKRIIAKFIPQAWVRDYAMEVDSEGEDKWDVTDAILSMPCEEALAMQDGQYESDSLRELPSAPKWVRDWGGPFCVEVEASIEKFFSP